MIVYTDHVMADPTGTVSGLAIGHGYARVGEVVHEIAYGGEARYLRELVPILDEGERPAVSIQPWQVLTRKVVDAPAWLP